MIIIQTLEEHFGKHCGATDFLEVASGTTSIIYRISGTSSVVKVLDVWEHLEFASVEGGLEQLYAALQQANAPLVEGTTLVSVAGAPFYQDGKQYPVGILMPNLTGKIGKVDYHPKYGFENDDDTAIRTTYEVVDTYLDILGRLHAAGIVISEQELNRGSHADNQALSVIPAVVEHKFVLLDWTNFMLIAHDKRLRHMLNDEEHKLFCLESDLVNYKHGFGALFFENETANQQRYFDSFKAASTDETFIRKYYNELIGQRQFKITY